MMFTAIRSDLSAVPGNIAALKAMARGYGKEIGLFRRHRLPPGGKRRNITVTTRSR